MEIIKFCKLIDQRSKYGKEVLHTQEGRRKFSVPSSETERGLTGRRRSETGYNEKGGRASNKMQPQGWRADGLWQLGPRELEP